MAGGAGMMGGLMYGSFFGRGTVWGLRVPRLWGEPLARAESLLVMMVGLGVVMVSLGLVLNIINRLRSRDVVGTVLDKFGLVGVVFYWGAIGLVLRYVILGKGAWWQVVAVLGVPMVLLVVGEPLSGYLRRRKSGDGGGGVEGASLSMALFEGAIGALEACMAYLTNTISFVRVGAFALAHAGFCLAVFETNRAVQELPGGAVW